LGLLVVAALTGCLVAPALARAASKDFSVNFAAAAPGSYNHATGAGGVWGNRVESLAPQDFACGDIVVFFAQISVSATTESTIQLDFTFGGQPTGHPGVGYLNIVSASANTADPANVTDGDETVSILNETGGYPAGDLKGMIQITNLGPGDKQLILRLEVRSACTPGEKPTGVLQATLDAGRVISPAADTINTGQQTIPLKGKATANQPIDTVPIDTTNGQNLPEGADLQLTKTPGATQVPPGGQVMYTLVVYNAGPGEATGVTVTDSPVPGLTSVTATPSQGSCTRSSCNLGTIVSGGSAQILVTANVSSTASGTLGNTGSVSGEQPDPDTANNRASATVPVTPPPQPNSDTSVNETAHGTGNEVIYTDTVTNNGPDPASGTTVTDTSSLPVKVVEAKPSQGTCAAGQTTTCSLGTLADGQSATVKIVVRVQRPGVAIHSVSVKSTGNDVRPNNNLARTMTTIRAILRLSKTAASRTVNPGGTVTFRLTVTNPNSIAVHNVKLCDQLPLGLAYVSSSPKATLSNGRRCWHFKTLKAHTSTTAKIVATALPGASGTLTNDATVTANGTRTARAHSRVRVIPPPPPPPPPPGLG
jgi:uncharacterized repeat protein (TIGR01451 family)